MEQYHDLLKEILGNGDVMFEPRTMEYTIGLGGWQSVYNLREGFPLLTTKKINPRLPFEELLWKLRGERSVKPLFDRNVHIWDENAFQHYLKRANLSDKMQKHTNEWEIGFEDYKRRLESDPDAINLGDLGPVYGYQWRYGFSRRGEKIDQLGNIINGIKNRPGSRYHLLSSWNPADLPNQALGPCPMIHHFNVFGNNLDLNMYQRSCDVFLGVPFNIAQDALFVHLVAKESNLEPRYFYHSFGNVHAYLGVPPRTEFWTNPENVAEFQRRFNGIKDKERYIDLREWYLNLASEESEGNERKDHIPFILEQLSKPPRKLPSIELRDIGFWEAIQREAGEVAEIIGYEPHIWDAKARMAA